MLLPMKLLQNDTPEKDETLLREPHLHNTLSGGVEPFTPQKKGKISMYSCGPTVYDHLQIGNLRAFLFADILKRTLTYAGYEVDHIMNLTDFGHLTSDADEGEDKMMLALKRAEKEITIDNMREIADVYIDSFKHDVDALNIIPPREYTRASDYVREQIILIKTLVEKGYTYETRDGIYFDTSRFKDYGKLGNQNIDGQKEGARVEKNSEKRNGADFAIWKHGELGWKSPWGNGFPGWHTECTAMIFASLGKQIDIHTGGIDHISVHHNNEIAQAEAATKKVPYVKYWLHNAFITIEGRRIGKSVGNAITLSQLKDRGYSPLVYRYWLLTGHYRSPMNFTFEALDGAKTALFRLRRHLSEEYRDAKGEVIPSYVARFKSAIYDDLNTPQAIALMWDLIKEKKYTAGEKRATILSFDEVLGLNLLQSDSAETKTLEVLAVTTLPEDVQTLLEKREAARSVKDWEKADELREAINLKGFLVEDSPEGAQVRRAE